MIDSGDDPSITAQDYRDLAGFYPTVGSVSGPGFSGSGVLIGDSWVLTAGHIALSKGPGSTVTLDGVAHAVASSIVHPSFSFSGPSGAPGPIFDIGLIWLASSVSGIAPAPMLQFTGALAGTPADWVGYGFTGTGISGSTGGPEFRAFTNIIDGPGSGFENLPPTSIVADFDQPGNPATNAPGSEPSATVLEGNLAPGDSGGGVFITQNGESYLVGIHSYRGTLDSFPAGTSSKYGAVSGATNLSLFHGWIFQESGLVPVPEPSALLLALSALPLLVRRRRIS